MKEAADARSKRFQNIRYHVVRIALFTVALICAVIGMLMFSFSTNNQSRVQTVVSDLSATDQQVDVLLLLSYDDSNIISSLERKGFVDIMRKSSVNVDVEYLDACALANLPQAQTQMEAALSAKVQAHGQYAAVVCAGDEALTFVEAQHEQLFSATPVVFFDVTDEQHAVSASKNGYSTGFYENTGMAQTLQATCNMLPNAKSFAVVVDSTEYCNGLKKQFEAALSDFKSMDVEFIDASAISRENLRERVSALGDDTILFYLGAAADSAGNLYTVDKNAYFLSEAAKTPVFCATSAGVGEGLCGGGFSDPELAGQECASTTIKVLNGTRPADIELVSAAPANQVYDASVLSKYGISSDALPANAVIVNQPAFSLENIKPLLLPIALVLVALVLVLIFAMLGYRRSIRDTREIIESRNDLQHRFYHDQLTGLPNLQWMGEYSDDALKGRKVKTLIKIDIDDFNDINDSYGHSTGDKVIIEFAKRLQSLNTPLLVHPSADEFILGFEHVIKTDGTRLESIREVIRRPFKFDDYDITVSACLGIAGRIGDMSTSELLSAADLAIRNAKESSGKNSTVFYTSEMRDEVESKIKITDKLREAIDNESLIVLYQPQVDVKTLDVCGYEALVRFENNEYYPNEFIPIAEMSGLVIEIDRLVTRKVIQQLATWKKRHKRLRPVSINYSATQLKDESYIDFVEGLLKEHDVSPTLLKIEITESMLIDRKDQANKLFNRLKKAGIQIALDDFGTGYTSLSRMSTIPADVIKIDKSLVDTYIQPGKESFFDNLTKLIHGVGKKIIVEGVETEEQFKICAKLGCDIVQGFYFSKPVLPERAAQYEHPNK